MNEWFEAEQRVERAHELYESGRWEDALQELRAALNVNPYQGEWHYNMGLTLDAMGRHDEAIECFERALSLHGEEPDILTNLAVNCLQADRPADALDYLNRALKRNPSEPADIVEIHAHCIEAHTRLAQHDQAELHFYLACQYDDALPRLYLNLADSLLERGDLDRSIWCLNRARRLDPSDPTVFGKLAHAHWHRGELDRAHRYYTRQFRADPTDTVAMMEDGLVLLEMGRPVEAAERFRRVAEFDPANAEAHAQLGELHLAAGDYDAAQMSFELVLRLAPSRPGTHRRLAQIALQRERENEARRHLRAELAIDGALDDAEAADKLGRVMIDADMPREASAIYKTLSERFPHSAEHANHHAVALFMDGRLEEGIRVCRRALRLDPGCILAIENLAFAHMQLGQTRRARLWIKRGLRLQPDDRRLRHLQSRLLFIVVRKGISRLIAR